MKKLLSFIVLAFLMLPTVQQGAAMPVQTDLGYGPTGDFTIGVDIEIATSTDVNSTIHIDVSYLTVETVNLEFAVILLPAYAYVSIQDEPGMITRFGISELTEETAKLWPIDTPLVSYRDKQWSGRGDNLKGNCNILIYT